MVMRRHGAGALVGHQRCAKTERRGDMTPRATAAGSAVPWSTPLCRVNGGRPWRGRSGRGAAVCAVGASCAVLGLARRAAAAERVCAHEGGGAAAARTRSGSRAKASRARHGPVRAVQLRR